MSGPNIFTYATGELSQDAFICWLIKWLDYDGSAEMHLAAKEFIVFLYNRANRSKICKNDIGKLMHLKRQQFNIDVFFVVEISGVETNFIIEDKTETFPHSGQLNKYRESVSKSKCYGANPLICIYYKTGHIYKKDRDICRDSLFCIINCESICEFFGGIKTKDRIFNDYVVYLNEKLRGREKVLAKLSSVDGFTELEHHYFQYEYVNKLALLCPETAGSNEISHGTSKGVPWTHYTFARTIIDGGIDKILYRIDKRMNKASGIREYCISIRQYSTPDTSHDKEQKKQRLKKLIRLFNMSKMDELESLAISPPRKDRVGANISDIGTIFFSSSNDFDMVDSVLPVMHRNFVDLLKPFEFTSLG